MVKLAVTGAHYGLRDWLVQRITAALMAVYLVLLATILIASPPHDYAAWRMLFSGQWFRIASFLFFVSLFWHAWIGMRNILMDYIHSTGTRLLMQILVILALLFYAVWSVDILWR